MTSPAGGEPRRRGLVPASLIALAGRLRAAVDERLREGRAAFSVIVLSASALAATQLARVGTQGARIGAAGLLALALLLVVLLIVAERRRWRSAKRAVVREVAKDDPALAGAIERASGLMSRSLIERDEAAAKRRVEGDDAREVAAELAALHLDRQLAKVRLDHVLERAESRGRAFAYSALVLALAGLAVAAIDPFRVVEGADVLLARKGLAPLPLPWLDDIDIVATPPAYVGRHEESLRDFDTTEQPRGTVLTVRGRPLKPGRTLVLTDGNEEVELVPDGKGMLVARWTVNANAELKIAARFGGVRVEQRDQLSVESVPDVAPEVKLVGAPKTIKLVDVQSLSLAYEASDDYGLREIALVLRSGPKEERRTLSRPNGNAKKEKGAYELSTQEAFFKKNYVPVEVTIEAKDNDEVVGPKWGTSPAYIVVPPLVGEPEALRYAALLQVRDVLVDLLAPRVTVKLASDAEAKARVATEREAQEKALAAIDKLIGQTYGGLSIRGRPLRVVQGQLRRLREAAAAYEKSPTTKTYAALVDENESVVLAVDAAARGLGLEDARKVTKRLADVAEEAAQAAQAARNVDESERGKHRLGAALDVLGGGAKELAKIGELGADLGDLTRAGVGRIGREQTAADFVGAELAARDLAERLRMPVFSIGGGGRPGVESGAGDGSSSSVGDGDASEADDQAEAGGREIDELVKRHQQEIERVQKALESAQTPEDKEALKKLAKEEAQAIRDAVKDLPEQGLPGSAASKAADGKRRAESMAGSLEKGNLKDAVKAGKEAVEALKDAKKLGDKNEFYDDEEVGKRADSANKDLKDSLERLKQAMDQVDQRTKEKAAEQLKEAGKNEGRMAERARDLKKRGEKGDATLPEDVSQQLEKAEKAMKEAQKALEEGDAETGQEKQREAQRLLEMSHDDDEGKQNAPRPTQSEEEGQHGEDGDKNFSQDSDVPGKDQHKGPEEFRKRVMTGLGKPGESRLKNAVKRYAEGLLK